MEKDVLWRTDVDVMEGSCAVARGKDTNNRHMGILESSRYNSFFKAGTMGDGRGYRNMYKIPRGSPLNLE
jgi:hypothetical protein